MNIIRFLLLSLAVLLAACIPVSGSSLDQAEIPAPTPRPAVSVDDPTAPLLLPGQRIIIQSASYSILVKDPSGAMDDLQQAVEQAGGYVVSASSWSGEGSSAYSSMSAKIPPEALHTLRAAVMEIADEVQNQSFYVQDATADYRKLQKRYQALMEAQGQTWQSLTQSTDPHMASTYRIVRELLDTELENVGYQLDSYAQQAELASFDVTLNQPAGPIITLE